jgi:CheY-like chemotaxis protein
MITIGRRLQILLVDDDEGHRELVRRNLERAGVTNRIVPLASGEEALARIAELQRQGGLQLLVLLDINMPGIDGIEVLRRIKSDPATQAIPVIMLTTTDDPREVSHCYALGCNIYVTKPVEPERFVEAIRKLGLFISVVEVPLAGGGG